MLALAAWPRFEADPRPRLEAAIDSLASGLSTLNPVRGEYRHDGPIIEAQLMRNDTRVLSYSFDKTLRLWDVATGKQIGPSMQHDGEVYGARLSKDETRIFVVVAS